MSTLDVAGLLLFIFYAVSFTKTPFAKVIADPDWQTWAVRIWALVLGIVGALVDSHFGSNAAWSGPQVYDAVKAGGAAAVGAIITYHIGQKGFLGVFDTAATASIAAAKQDPLPAVVTTTQTVTTEPRADPSLVPLPAPDPNFKPYTPPPSMPGSSPAVPATPTGT